MFVQVLANAGDKKALIRAKHSWVFEARVREALAFALARTEVLAGDFARHAGMSVQNASNLFKQLWEQGFLLRSEGIAPSGGPEFTYRRIG